MRRRSLRRCRGPQGRHVRRHSDFARTLLTNFPLQGILDRLVERIPDVLPITGAGITLISPGLAPQYIAASNEDAL